MARYIGPVCRLCRREGVKLYLKGDRCNTEKCSLSRRAYPPGQHGQSRVKLSEYGIRLREKQKVRRIYGIVEKQFQKYYFKASRHEGRTGEQILSLVESRLDNVVYRLGFSFTRSQARQLVRHGHVLINNKKVTIPSYLLHAGDIVSLTEQAKSITDVIAAFAKEDQKTSVSWLEVNKSLFSGIFKGSFVRDELNEPSVREQYIVEYYSR